VGSGKGLIAGVDVSGESLRHARDPAGTVGLDAAFVQCDVYDVAAVLDRSSDVVYTSRGVPTWLPDPSGWGRRDRRGLADDGVVYLVEGHPVAAVSEAGLEPTRSYVRTGPGRSDGRPPGSVSTPPTAGPATG